MSGNRTPGVLQRIDSRTEGIEKILERANQLWTIGKMRGIFSETELTGDEKQIKAVFEFPRGISLERYLAAGETITEEFLCRAFSSLLMTLGKLEECGLKDLSVTPDKLYIQEDGSIWLFPELKKSLEDRKDYTYTVSELIYYCLTGKKVPDKALRILFDELEPLDETDPKGNPEFHRIVEKGLETDPDMNYRNPTEFAESLKKWRTEKQAASSTVE